MAGRTGSRDHRAGAGDGGLSRQALPHRMLGGAALASIAAACICAFGPQSLSLAERSTVGPERPDHAAFAYAKLEIALRTYAKRLAGKMADGVTTAAITTPSGDALHAKLADRFEALLSPRLLGFASARFAKAEIADDAAAAVDNSNAAPLVARPALDRLALRKALPRVSANPTVANAATGEGARTSVVAVDKPPEKPSFFERLFGRPSPLTLAYAATDDGGLDGAQGATGGRYDRYTAVYDITAHKVYLPDGTAFEAHSGLGSMMDDPRYAAERNRGVTPPAIYDLQPREALFHGVAALRLIPQDEDKALGRTGLLAHSYMLGPNGQSNGCVSFKDYEAFLRAYREQNIKHLAVVTRLE